MSNDKRRFCVFCGRQPEAKNNEHVIPRWLINITGDPKRTMHIGPLFSQRELYKQFSFDQFRFPACSSCNSAYADLEDQAKCIMSKLLMLDKVSASDFDIFLDWFDKIRVGLWLGYHQLLDKNLLQITPNYYISGRIGNTDRLLMIYRTDRTKTRLSFSAINAPAFAYSPTCFSLIVNNLTFTSISADFLLSRRVGLPYPKSYAVNDDNMLVVSTPLLAGSEMIDYPVVDLRYDRRCGIVAQPIFKKVAGSCTDEYAGTYVKNMTLSPGKIRPIIQTQSLAKLYSAEASYDWLPAYIHDAKAMLYTSTIQTLRLQIELLSMVRVWKNDPNATRRAMKYKMKQCIKINSRLISLIKDGKEVSED